MANDSINWYVINSLCSSLNRFSNFKLMSEFFQNIIIGIIGLLAVAFLVKKFVWNPKKKKSNSCGSDGCGC